jgi:hypothetical protein
MAASFSVTVQCAVCGTTQALTNTTEAAKGTINAKEERYKCTSCGIPFPIAITLIALTHTGDVGANQTLTHTMATLGTIVSAASNPS